MVSISLFYYTEQKTENMIISALFQTKAENKIISVLFHTKNRKQENQRIIPNEKKKI
jgi:hypothetical protein